MGVNFEIKDLRVKDVIYDAVQFYLRIGNHEQAKKLLYLQLQDGRAKWLALDKWVSLAFKTGNYLYVRELLEPYASENRVSFSYGLLESVESNYEASKAYYEKCFDSKMEDKAKLAIARLEIQLGNYKKAEEIFEGLHESGKYLDQLPFDLIFLNIVRKQYDEAYHRFQEINPVFANSNSNHIRNYRQLNIYLRYKLGILDVSTISLKDLNDYFLYRYLTDAPNVLLKHISYHKSADTSDGFFKKLNSADLLEETTSIIQKLNPSHFNMIDKYKFRMDRPIGYINQELTHDICVETVIGTDKILTMYPILLSDEFDKEGNGTSEELRRKREMIR